MEAMGTTRSVGATDRRCCVPDRRDRMSKARERRRSVRRRARSLPDPDRRIGVIAHGALLVLPCTSDGERQGGMAGRGSPQSERSEIPQAARRLPSSRGVRTAVLPFSRRSVIRGTNDVGQQSRRKCWPSSRRLRNHGPARPMTTAAQGRSRQPCTPTPRLVDCQSRRSQGRTYTLPSSRIAAVAETVSVDAAPRLRASARRSEPTSVRSRA
jgi:hypothetical protein